jgi:hypothetical protein
MTPALEAENRHNARTGLIVSEKYKGQFLAVGHATAFFSV